MAKAYKWLFLRNHEPQKHKTYIFQYKSYYRKTDALSLWDRILTPGIETYSTDILLNTKVEATVKRFAHVKED